MDNNESFKDSRNSSEKTFEKKLNFKYVIGIVLIAFVLCMMILPLLLKNSDDYMSEGNYQKAYNMTKDTIEQQNIYKESTIAYISNRLKRQLKDDASFELMEAYYISGEVDTNKYENVVLSYKTKNSFGDYETGNAYYYVRYGKWIFGGASDDLKVSKVSYWDDEEEMQKKF